MRIAISACLLGEACRFDGGSRPCAVAFELAARGDVVAVPICPETAGGLSRPRPPAEIVVGDDGGRRVLDATGRDLTAAFERGARSTLDRVRESGCSLAVLKAKSPSCGLGRVYDGTFSGVLANGNGVAAQLLLDAGVECIDEVELERRMAREGCAPFAG